MRRIIIILLFMITLSGCSVNYEIDYFDDVYKENCDVVFYSNELIDNENYFDYLNNNYKDFLFITSFNSDPGDLTNDEILKNYEVYNTKINDNGIVFNYLYNKNNKINDSSLIHYLFENVNIDENNINIREINNIFDNYTNLEEIIISLKTDKYITGGNFDKEENDRYYWIINKDNYKNKTIEVSFSDKYLDKVLYKTNTNSNKIIDIVILLLMIVVLLGILVIYNRVKKSSK